MVKPFVDRSLISPLHFVPLDSTETTVPTSENPSVSVTFGVSVKEKIKDVGECVEPTWFHHSLEKE